MDENYDDLQWHALNYRTANIIHAEACWQELLACVDRRVSAAVAAEKQAAWGAVNRWIVLGDLGGNGCDNNAQRNGMILAANVLRDRIAGPNVGGEA